jgi:hypothetical protein
MQGGAWAVTFGLVLLLALPLWATVNRTLQARGAFTSESGGATMARMAVAEAAPQARLGDSSIGRLAGTGPLVAMQVARASQSIGMASGLAEEQFPKRTLHFPGDRSLGYLSVAAPSTSTGLDSQREARWNPLGSARGTVAIPPGKRIRLSIEGAATSQDPSPLAALRRDDLDELRISGWGSEDLDGDAVLPHVRGLTGLKVLSLEQLRVSQRGIASLRDLRALESLTITTPPGSPGQPASELLLDDNCLAVLAELKNLEMLMLSSPNNSDECLGHLAKKVRLRELYLWSPQLRGPGLAQLNALPLLRSLATVGGPGNYQ